MMAIAVPQSDPFVLHSCYYQDFFLLRTSIIIGGYVPEIRVDDGVPVLHIPPDLRRLQCKDVAVGLPQISNKFAPILFRFGVYHVDTFYYVHFPLLSVMFFSRDNIKKFLSSLADNEVQPLLANELQRIITGNNSSILVKVECGLFLVTLHSSLGSKPKAHQVTLENYLQCIVEWEHSRVFHFESSIFDGKELVLKFPELTDLVHELHEVTDWFSLGIHLRISESQLLAIRQDCHGKTSDCRTHMLIAWKSCENATWTKLVAALYRMDCYRRLAYEIARKYGVTVPEPRQSDRKIEDLERRLKVVQYSNLNITQDMEKIRHESLPHQHNQVHSLQEEVIELEKLLALKKIECSVLEQCRKKLKNEREVLKRMLREKEDEVQQLNIRLEEKQAMLLEVKQHIVHLEKELLKKELEVKEKAELEQKLKQELETLKCQFNQVSHLKSTKLEDFEEHIIMHHQRVTKVLIPSISSKFSKEELACYLESLTHNEVKCEVEFHRSDAIATFQYPIDVDALLLHLRETTVESNHHVSTVYPLQPTPLIVVSNIPHDTQNLTLVHHFEKFMGDNSVKGVKFISPSVALVTFINAHCVQKALAEPALTQMEGSHVVLKEYYSFMELDYAVIPTSSSKYTWSTQRIKLPPERYDLLKGGLDMFNQKLKLIKANAALEDQRILCVSPQQDASLIYDWEDSVKRFLEEYFDTFHDHKIHISKESKAEVLSYVFSEESRPPNVGINLQDECLSVSGSCNDVQKVIDEINEIIIAAQVSTKDICCPRKHIRFLVKFWSQVLKNTIPAVDYEPLVDQSVIQVTANPKGFTAFEMVIEEQLKQVQEETIELSPDLYQLLSSARGEAKIMEVVGTEMPKILYDFEEANHDSYILCILSCDKESCRYARRQLLPYTHFKILSINQQKIRACTDKKWRELDHSLTAEHFVVISVYPEKSQIVVSGEITVLDDIIVQLKKFLQDHTSVEEQIKMDANVWNVVSLNYTNEISALVSDAKSKHVAITRPKYTSQQDPLTIIIRGEPKDVDDFKLRLQVLGMKVCHKEAKIYKVPALVHVLGSMDDRINVLRSTNKASIELHFENGTAEDSQVTGELPRNLCSATASNGSRVNVYMGDFTQNPPVTAILNFVSLDPHINIGPLKLLASAAGQEMQDDFQQKLSQHLVRKPGLIFQTKHGQLKCSHLLHCFLPPWNQSASTTGIQHLEKGLKKFLYNANPSSSVLITPFTSKPLEYPVEVFSEKLLEVCSNQNIQVTVYVDEIDQARVFEELLTDKKFVVHTHGLVQQVLKPTASLHPPTSTLTSARSISNPIKSFISLTQGDMLKQQAEVFINSTNTNLNLKQGILSKKLLEICGDNFQKACSAYAPLNTGDVAVTEAKNLPCKFIFHIALPDYQNKNSEKMFQKTVCEVLKTANERCVKSIAIPSLGVGNLNYPASVSARILFDEVIAFRAQFPNASIQKFHFVIFEKKVYEEFSKEYAQRMNDGVQVRIVGQHAKSDKKKQGGSLLLGVFKVNIADETTDVIVNTTTEDMNLSSNAVSRAILKTASPKLQTICQQLVENGIKLEHGQILMMNATGELPCKKIIHACVPVCWVATNSYLQYIGVIVTNCLKKADTEGLKSITFPAFSFGLGGYKVHEVADPILKAIKEFSQTNPTSLKIIRIAIFDQDQHQKFYNHFCKFFDYDPSLASPTSPTMFQTLKEKLNLGSSHDHYIELNQGVPGRAQPSTPPPLWAVSMVVRSKNLVAVFQIYAASDQKCNEIEKLLRDDIKQRAVTRKLDFLIGDYMIEDDMEDIQKFEDQFGVEVKLMMQEKEIQISGESAKVSEAAMKIKDLVIEIERAESELRLLEWQWVDDDGATEVYQYEASVKLERAFRKNLEAIEMIVENVSVVVDLKSWEEIDKSTGKRHAVKRVKKPHTIEYPSTWEDEPLKDGKPVMMHMFPVVTGTPEYQDAIKEFEDTVGVTHTIVEVKRIQNRNEYSRYIALRDAIQRKHNKPVATRRLFHGSKQESLELIAFRGFNRNFAADVNAAYYGRGVYFAVNASYSAQKQYSVPDKGTGNQHMFVCSVLVGEYTKGTRDMKVAPPLQPGSKDVFDSLVEDEKNPTIFVALTDAQAYPEYLITFKV